MLHGAVSRGPNRGYGTEVREGVDELDCVRPAELLVLPLAVPAHADAVPVSTSPTVRHGRGAAAALEWSQLLRFACGDVEERFHPVELILEAGHDLVAGQLIQDEPDCAETRRWWRRVLQQLSER